MVQPGSPGSPVSQGLFLLRSENLEPDFLAVVQLPKSLPVMV